jgi:hypothetical protein
MSTLNVNRVADASGGVLAPISSVHRNRIINGQMTIDQRNAGASVTITNTAANTYTLDRWYAYGNVASKFSVQQDAGAVTPPVGFTDYLGVTSLAATTVGAGDQYIIAQAIEGFNVSDLAWGTANAKTVTLSFWVRSSLTGTFGGSIQNSAANRSYPFSYTISAANTWEQKSITIAGDTTGTWLVTNGVGLKTIFSLGTGSTYSATAGAWNGSSFITSSTGATSVVSTNGATFYITGVQLEVGTQATSFEYRQYQQELALCQRYCLRIGDGLTGVASSANGTYLCPSLINPMRASPTTTLWDNSVKISDNYSADYTSTGSTLVESSLTAFGGRININGFTGLTAGRVYQAYGNSDGYVFILSAEL